MTVTHELGHVVGGLASGARLVHLELRPWHFPHSQFVENSYPLVTLWCGPCLGIAAPMIAAIIIRTPAAWFVAWFCVIANASYLLLGYFAGGQELDTGRIMNAGGNTFTLFGFVALTFPIGYVKFRAACVALLSGETTPMSPRITTYSALALLVALATQTVIALAVA